MESVLKVYIPDSHLRAAVQAVLPLLDFSVAVLDHLPEQGLERGDEILSFSPDTPVRLGGILDWIFVRANGLRGVRAAMPDLISLAWGTFFVKKQMFVPEMGDPVRLTDRESDFLGALYRADGNLMAKPELLNLVWGYAAGAETHTIETHLYRLRQKIERDAATPENILTTDRGYQLVLVGGKDTPIK